MHFFTISIQQLTKPTKTNKTNNMKTTKILTTRSHFINKNLWNLPKDVVEIICDFDPYYSKKFSNHVLKNLQEKVFAFWQNKSIDLINNRVDTEPNTYYSKITYFSHMMFYIVPQHDEFTDVDSTDNDSIDDNDSTDDDTVVLWD
jgi:hypothetical protein